MRPDPIILYGVHCQWQGGREILPAYPVAYGVAQMMATPFNTLWAAAGDIVAYDPEWCVTTVIIRNSRLHFGQFDIDGLDESQICRRAGRLGRFLTCHCIGWTFVPRFPGIFSMSVDVRVPLEGLMDIADRSPVQFRVMRRNEIRAIRCPGNNRGE